MVHDEGEVRNLEQLSVDVLGKFSSGPSPQVTNHAGSITTVHARQHTVLGTYGIHGFMDLHCDNDRSCVKTFDGSILNFCAFLCASDSKETQVVGWGAAKVSWSDVPEGPWLLVNKRSARGRT